MKGQTIGELLSSWSIPSGYSKVRIRDFNGDDKKPVTLHTLPDKENDDTEVSSILSWFEGRAGAGRYQVQLLDGSGKAIQHGSRSFIIEENESYSGPDRAVKEIAAVYRDANLQGRIAVGTMFKEYTAIVRDTVKAFPKALDKLSDSVGGLTHTNSILRNEIDEKNRTIATLSKRISDLESEAQTHKWKAIEKAVDGFIDARKANLDHLADALNNAPDNVLLTGASKLYEKIDKGKRVRFTLGLIHTALKVEGEVYLPHLPTIMQEIDDAVARAQAKSKGQRPQPASDTIEPDTSTPGNGSQP